MPSKTTTTTTTTKNKREKKTLKLFLKVKRQFCIVKFENSFPKISPEQINLGGFHNLKKKKRKKENCGYPWTDFGLIITIGPELSRNTISNYTKQRRAKL